MKSYRFITNKNKRTGLNVKSFQILLISKFTAINVQEKSAFVYFWKSRPDSQCLKAVKMDWRRVIGVQNERF